MGLFDFITDPIEKRLAPAIRGIDPLILRDSEGNIDPFGVSPDSPLGRFGDDNRGIIDTVTNPLGTFKKLNKVVVIGIILLVLFLLIV